MAALAPTAPSSLAVVKVSPHTTALVVEEENETLWSCSGTYTLPACSAIFVWWFCWAPDVGFDPQQMGSPDSGSSDYTHPTCLWLCLTLTYPVSFARQ